MIAALKEIVAACKTNGIRAALHCGTPDYAARAIEWGFDMTTVSGDSRLLAGAAGASVAKFRQLTGETGSKSENGRCRRTVCCTFLASYRLRAENAVAINEGETEWLLRTSTWLGVVASKQPLMTHWNLQLHTQCPTLHSWIKAR